MRAMGWSALLVGLSCAPSGHPGLELTLSPKSIGDVTPVKVRVAATNAAGQLGIGTVKITSAAGSLKTPVEVQLDKYWS